MGETRIPVSEETRDEILKPRKRGGESYDDLIRRLVAGESDAGGVGNLEPFGGEVPALDEDAIDELFDELEAIRENAVFEPLDAPEWDLDGVRATLSTLEDRTARIENQLDKIQRGKLEDLEGRR